MVDSSSASESSNAKESLEALMVRGLAGDQKAYAALLQQLAKIVRGYLYRKIPQEQDLEDVVQEVLVSIHRARKTYDGSRPLKPWVLAIAGYRLNDYLRKLYRTKSREVVDYDTMENVLEEPVTEPQFDSELLDMAVKSLPNRQQKIVTMMKVDGYSAKEVAKRMDMSVPAVKVAAHRGYKKMKDFIEREQAKEEA